MQEQFENENNEQLRDPAIEEAQSAPTANERVTDSDFEERVRREIEERVRKEAEESVRRELEERVRREAEEREQRQAEERAKKDEARKALRFASSRLGWATVVLVAVWMGTMFAAQSVLLLLDSFGGFSAEAFFGRYSLIINELTLAVGIAVAAGVLRSVQRVNINREAISAGRFMKILLMCFGAGYIGNMIGSRLLSLWNVFTGNSAGDELETLLFDIDPLLMFISVGILAPILEELFFRKILTERLRVFGETTAILLPAFLFALFHQSAEQIVYAFAVGVLLGYFYCRTGKYWLTVLIHAIFNTVSGVIPMLFMPKVNGFYMEMENLFGPELEALETLDPTAIWDMIQPLLTEYGLALGLYALYALVILAVDIAGVVVLVVNVKKFKAKGGEYALTFKESAGTVFRTPGVIVCTVVLGILTLTSLFA